MHSRHTWDHFRLADTREGVAQRREWANAITGKLALELSWVFLAYFVAGKLGQATTAQGANAAFMVGKPWPGVW